MRLNQSLPALRMEEGSPAKDCSQPLDARKDQEEDSPLDPPAKNAALLTS